MSDSNKTAGFSFQISETPPPAQAADGTPLADLDLDMGDFGLAPEPSPLPVSVRAAPDISAWVEDPPVAAPAPVAPTEEPASAPAPTKPRVKAQVVESQAVEPAPKMVEPAPEAAAPEPQVAPQIAKSEDTAREAPAPSVAAEPRLKKIQFPARSSKGTATRNSQPAKKLVSKTKFSKSISAQGPRPQLDSEPEIDEPVSSSSHGVPSQSSSSQSSPLQSSPLQGAPSSAPAQAAQLAPPEDLPGTDSELLPPTEADGTWGTDTPSAREIWQKARTTWHSASKQAAVLGGQGVRASKALAETMNEKVRQRLREAAEERKAQAEARHLEASAETAGDPIPAGPSAGAGPGPSRAGQVILGLAKTTGRKMAAPVSAIAAATMFYFAGTHLLGTDGTIALSKAVQGPEIPELGTLESEEGAQADSPTDSADEDGSEESQFGAKPSKKKSKGPEAMQTEVTEMPDGLSWPGKGLIEVVTSGEELVYVDGVFTGRGPLRRIPVSPGEHEVSIRSEGSERTGSVEVQANKNTRAVFKGE